MRGLGRVLVWMGSFFALILVLIGKSTGSTAAEPSAALASSRIPADRLQQYSDLAVTWMQEYLRMDTTNPPGNEMRGVAFYKKILDQEGIENRVFEYAPGRGDLWARIPATPHEEDPHFSQNREKWGTRTRICVRLFCSITWMW